MLVQQAFSAACSSARAHRISQADIIGGYLQDAASLNESLHIHPTQSVFRARLMKAQGFLNGFKLCTPRFFHETRDSKQKYMFM